MSSTTEMIDTLLAKAMTLNKKVDRLEAVKLRTDICEIIQHDPKDTSDSDILRTIREYEEFTNMNMDEWDVVQGVAHGGREHEDEIRRLQAENEKLKEEIVKIKAEQMTIFNEAQESMVDDDDERIEHMLGCEHSERADAVEKLKEENEKLKKKLEHKEDKIEDHLASRNFYEEQCQELKQEIKELKEKMDSICIELYACWNRSCDLDDENIGDICGYDEDKHKKLYEKKYPEDED